ncbi:uncharacterized protein LOC108202314 [Daucus carota subsp. sativus]|uniref:uncharacterized protein LOC108202314 n=1 Tax=Daucus carota subsp. sativus TaxID=79200 RepID=UPI0030829EFE
MDSTTHLGRKENKENHAAPSLASEILQAKGRLIHFYKNVPRTSRNLGPILQVLPMSKALLNITEDPVGLRFLLLIRIHPLHLLWVPQPKVTLSSPCSVWSRS